VPPIIRYDLRDVMVLSEREECACGLATRKLGPSSAAPTRWSNCAAPTSSDGLPDRGAEGSAHHRRLHLRAFHVGEGLGRREEMTVRVERRSVDIDAGALAEDLRRALHRDLGVRVDVEIVEPGSLAVHTRMGGEGKPRRLLDLRK